MQTRDSTYVIVREDLDVDPLTLSTDGLKIGRLPDCEIVLNHPTVSRLHAGIKEVEGEFYLYNFSHSSGTTLNGRLLPVETAEVLADGDLLHIGPFFLHVSRLAETLRLSVSLQVAAAVGEGEATPAKRADAPKAAHVPAEVSNALSLFWASRKREAGKMQRLSPLRPHKQARILGKSRFNWTPTRDLVRPWPASLFVWAVIVVAALTVLAAIGYTRAFSPAPLSGPHTRDSLTITPAVALRPNADSCTTCHTLTARMDDSCASCHTTDAFSPAVTRAHQDAGLGCADCHGGEHRGADFPLSPVALQSCASCHTDANARTYNGRRVGTPHGGTVGYPVVGGEWVWRGLDETEWRTKPEGIQRALERWPQRTERERRSAQFHALHMHRVRTVQGLTGNAAGEVSCSTCHATFFPTVDRMTPPRTCAACHNGDVDARHDPPIVAPDAPNCTSCHVQHTKGRRLWGTTLTSGSGSPGS
jgi:hypothetical protein